MTVLAAVLAGSAAASEEVLGDGVALLEVVQMTLENDPTVALAETDFDIAQGVLQTAGGRFDAALTAGLSYSDSETPLSELSLFEEQVLEQSVGATKLFRSGLSLEPGIRLSSTDNPILSTETVNVAILSFTVRQPLMRGRGRDATGALELAAERRAEASAFDLQHTLAERIRAVVVQYWLVERARRNLEILRASENDAAELLGTIRELVNADLVPSAELVQLEANLAAKASSRIGGEQALFEARQNLGREIGLEYGRIRSLPLPADTFPALGSTAGPGDVDEATYVQEALARRADLEAARRRQLADEALEKSAVNSLKPALDLVLNLSYAGVEDGGSFFDSLYNNFEGPSSLAALSFSWPRGNNAARGALLQAEAARRQRELIVESFVKAIGADVATAVDAVRQAALQLEQATSAVSLFERAVVNEAKKLQAESSTLIDVISQRDRLTAALQSQVAAHLALALALVDLRFETGTLIEAEAGGEPGGLDLTYARLTTLPFAQGEVP